MSQEEVPESEVNLRACRLDICRAVSTVASEVIVHVEHCKYGFYPANFPLSIVKQQSDRKDFEMYQLLI